MTKLSYVRAARKPQGKCGGCGVPIVPGDSYRSWPLGYRSKARGVRCMKPACSPRRSEIESGIMADAFAAQEDCAAEIDAAVAVADITDALETCAQSAQDVASQYEDAVSRAPMLEESVRGKIEALETWADDLGRFDPAAEFGLGDADAETSVDYDTLQAVKDAAREVVDGLEA
jgi:hypothetical protein